MLSCSKLSGAGEGTFSKVPDVDKTSVAGFSTEAACSCDVVGWSIDAGFSSDSP